MWSSNAQKRWFAIRFASLVNVSVVSVSVINVSLIGCTPLNGAKPGIGVQPVEFAIDTATIAVISQPANVNAIVQVKGKVGNRAPLLGKTAYELQDATGRIWVLANDSIPNAGDEVVVKGKLLYQSIQLNGKEQGAIYLEQQQLQHTAGAKSEG